MHCFGCGEVLDHVAKMIFDMRYRGDLCWCHVPVIWCEDVSGDHTSDLKSVSVRHTIDFVENGVWGHTCPRHKPRVTVSVTRPPKPVGRSYLILPCTSDTPLVRRS